MKKTVSLLLTLTMLFALAGCGRSAPAPTYAPEVPEAAFYGEEAAPEAYEPIPAPAPKAVRASDFQYAFWSGSILAGVALTLFSFIYACVM